MRLSGVRNRRRVNLLEGGHLSDSCMTPGAPGNLTPGNVSGNGPRLNGAAANAPVFVPGLPVGSSKRSLNSTGNTLPPPHAQVLAEHQMQLLKRAVQAVAHGMACDVV